MREFEYRFEPLGERLRICVTPEHKFGCDAFLLSDFASPRRKDIVCDLCAGCGIVPALWFRREEDAPGLVYAVELQSRAVAQMEVTVRMGGLPEGRMVPLCADLRELADKLPAACCDLVTCNPPYRRTGAGLQNEAAPARIARHETMCSLEDVCAAARRLLRYGGRLCVCHRPDRLPDLISAMRENRIEPKRLRMVQQRPETAPWLVLLEGRLGGKPSLRVDAPLIVEGEGGFSPEMLRIYQKEHNL